jgi:hypothetical protein
MRELFLRGVLDEVPHIWRSHCVELLSLLLLLQGLLVVLICPLLSQLLLVGNPFFLVLVNELLHLRFGYTFESLQNNEIFNILEDLIIDVFQLLNSIEPQIFVLLVEIALPSPVPAVLPPLSLLQASLFLPLGQVEEIHIRLIGEFQQVDFLFRHF